MVSIASLIICSASAFDKIPFFTRAAKATWIASKAAIADAALYVSFASFILITRRGPAQASIISAEGVVNRNPERPVTPGVVFRSSRAVLELITRSDDLLAATAGMNTSCARG